MRVDTPGGGGGGKGKPGFFCRALTASRMDELSLGTGCAAGAQVAQT
jgi:hypothetical protein